MAQRLKFTLVAIPLAAMLIFSFQNCGTGFQTVQLNSQALVDLSTGMEVPVTIVDSKNVPVTKTTEIIVDGEYHMSISGVRLPADALVTWTATITPGGVVHTHPGLTMADAELHCEMPGIITVSVSVRQNNQTYSSKPMNISCQQAPDLTPAPTPDPNAATVTFRIPAGTNKSAWNTAATTVTVYVGQTLKIVNDDSIVHRLHTGNAPCNHQPSDSAPGATFDCVVQRPIVAANGGTYDHNIGTGARFYVTAIDGKALYATNCQGCHGAIATSQHRNATPAKIKSQIATQNEMKGIVLSDDQIAAVAYSLSH
ncbi:hypothetical protein BH10BDE1_BH10BDE1_32970 [soil metagenome]